MDESPEQVADAAAVAAAIEAYRLKYSCGEAGCESCLIGIAIGLKHLDQAYNAGAKKRSE